MIKINENYTITGRDLNFIVECFNENKEINTDEQEKVSNKKNKYFSTIEGLCSFVASQNNIDEDILIKISELSDKAIETYNIFSEIELEKNRKVKVDIGGTWFVIGTYSCYRVIKKEYIKESRFTKEENIGKDKFITYGFAPNLHIALKIILSESVLEFLSREEDNEIEDLKEYIDKIILDVENMNIIDTDDIDINEEEDYEDVVGE